MLLNVFSSIIRKFYIVSLISHNILPLIIFQRNEFFRSITTFLKSTKWNCYWIILIRKLITWIQSFMLKWLKQNDYYLNYSDRKKLKITSTIKFNCVSFQVKKIILYLIMMFYRHIFVFQIFALEIEEQFSKKWSESFGWIKKIKNFNLRCKFMRFSGWNL